MTLIPTASLSSASNYFTVLTAMLGASATLFVASVLVLSLLANMKVGRDGSQSTFFQAHPFITAFSVIFPFLSLLISCLGTTVGTLLPDAISPLVLLCAAVACGFFIHLSLVSMASFYTVSAVFQAHNNSGVDNTPETPNHPASLTISDSMSTTSEAAERAAEAAERAAEAAERAANALERLSPEKTGPRAVRAWLHRRLGRGD